MNDKIPGADSSHFRPDVPGDRSERSHFRSDVPGTGREVPFRPDVLGDRSERSHFRPDVPETGQRGQHIQAATESGVGSLTAK